jgi:hypothetical protein
LARKRWELAAVLAEIFILRLEIAVRAAQRPKEGSPKELFVPFN